MTDLYNPTIAEFFVTYCLLLGATLLWERYLRRTLTYPRGVFYSLLIGYAMITLLLMIQPMGGAERSVIAPDDPLINFEPFRIIAAQLQSVQGHWLIMWHIFLPIPFIFFVGFIGRGRLSWLGFLMVGFAASIGAELCLFLMNAIPQFPKHLFDIDRLILNGIGVSLGTLLFCWMETKQWMRECIVNTMSAR
ncbi:VanZ family protein [Sporolactobacillus inulinus]|uniref:VanZ-like domain-containing protein n=1 Tax=Sporolactobacillus inulinus CASD TaxID=1069536 RepID=A0A0U1QLR3_9BACL|nr:VanZ family protein [Sporolactobacillus inulinus]KLI01745.1 hypothetical protein SINU_11840 [Sporolactobacillus inulinus CASD]GEB78085.1 hypothetical protein SIN01_24300 [Sporolactobacillus inulinus]